MNEEQSERQVRAAFEDSHQPAAPGFDVRMRAGLMAAPPVTASRGRAIALIAPIVALAILLVLVLPRLLATSPAPANRAQAVIPWLPLPAQFEAPVSPSPTPSPLPAGTKSCTSAQLKVNDLGRNGAGGTVFRYFGFAGRGPGRCFVEGTPAVELFDRAGRKLPFHPRAPLGGAGPTAPILVEPGPLPKFGTNLQPGQAGLGIEWVSQPEQCPGSAAVDIASASITLATGGPALTVALAPPAGGYTCQGLGIGTFAGPPPPIEEPPVLPLPAITLKTPSSVRAGQVLEYQVMLTNDTLESIDLVANCPNYGQELFPNASSGNPTPVMKPLFQLNCAVAGAILPNATLNFEMRLTVPRETAPSPYFIVFQLSYWNSYSDPASGTLRVTS
jgi:Protein of unknown function (DUF4232)